MLKTTLTIILVNRIKNVSNKKRWEEDEVIPRTTHQQNLITSLLDLDKRYTQQTIYESTIKTMVYSTHKLKYHLLF